MTTKLEKWNGMDKGSGYNPVGRMSRKLRKKKSHLSMALAGCEERSFTVYAFFYGNTTAPPPLHTPFSCSVQPHQ